MKYTKDDFIIDLEANGWYDSTDGMYSIYLRLDGKFLIYKRSLENESLFNWTDTCYSSFEDCLSAIV